MNTCEKPAREKSWTRLMKWEWNAEDLLVKFLWKGKYFHGSSWNIF